MRTSFRVRLALWNMVVLALVLSGAGAMICYHVQASMATAIDQELATRARRFDAGRLRFAAWRAGRDERHRDNDSRHDGKRHDRNFNGWQSGPPPPFNRERDGRRAEGRRDDGKRDDRHEDKQRGDKRREGRDRNVSNPTPPVDADTERIAALRRPRLFDVHGKSMGPFAKDGPWDNDAFRLAVAGKEHYSTISLEQERWRVFSMPMYEHGAHAGQKGPVIGVMQLARELTMYDQLLSDQVRILLTLVPLALLVTGIGGLFLTNRALRPVHQVTQAAAEIGAHDLARRLEVNGKDELAELASTFNGMIARLHESFGNLGSAYSKLEAAYEQQRRFTADASHELRTPLARIKGSTSLALVGEWSPEEYRHALVVADEAADKMNRIIQDLLLLARSDAGQLLQPGVMDLAMILEGAVAAVPNESGVAVTVELPPAEIEIVGDADHLSQVFSNLLENAMRHTPATGCITLAAQPQHDQVVVTVTDTGEGIPAEHIPHIFERFYRVDAARSRNSGGTGLGLAISQSIVQSHGGTIHIDKSYQGGTRVVVTLPYGDVAAYRSDDSNHKTMRPK